ncbi:ion transporter [Algivirga pacifica]|uniref:Ion transporter n=1 Tax=Algivirga pacifica TaxID=1162670 RepID=A0ABP9DLZ9_9BACT
MRSPRPWRKIIYDVIDNEKDIYTRIFDAFMMGLITLNVVAIVLSSYQSLYNTYKAEFELFEKVSVIIFTIEIILRVLVAEYHYNEKRTFRAVARYLVSFGFIIDFLAILPFYLPMLISIDLRFLRMLRLLRMIRLFKITRYSESVRSLGDAISERKDELLLTAFLGLMMLFLSGTLMYFVEHEAQPEAFPDVLSSLWWAVATLTTVGYGDVYPITPFGKFIAGAIAFLGVGLVALPTGILSSAFMESLAKKKARQMQKEQEAIFGQQCTCPNCGEKIMLEETPEFSQN